MLVWLWSCFTIWARTYLQCFSMWMPHVQPRSGNSWAWITLRTTTLILLAPVSLILYRINTSCENCFTFHSIVFVVVIVSSGRFCCTYLELFYSLNHICRHHTVMSRIYEKLVASCLGLCPYFIFTCILLISMSLLCTGELIHRIEQSYEWCHWLYMKQLHTVFQKFPWILVFIWP